MSDAEWALVRDLLPVPGWRAGAAGRRATATGKAMELLGRIQRTGRVHDRHVKDLNEEFGGNMSEVDVLFTLRRAGPPCTLTAGELLKASTVTSGAVNRVDRMKAKGLVERLRDSVDRRSALIRLTRRGTDLADEVMTAHLRGYDEILSVLTPEECEQIVSGPRKILEAQGDTRFG